MTIVHRHVLDVGPSLAVLLVVVAALAFLLAVRPKR